MAKKPKHGYIDRRKHAKADDLLHSEHKRTGAAAVQILRISASVPASLSKDRINNILNYRVWYYSKQEYDFLIWAFSRLPTVEYIKLTPQKISRLEALIAEKNVGLAKISKAMPRHLKIDRGMLKKWMNREIQSARKECYEAVLWFLERYTFPMPKFRINSQSQNQNCSDRAEI